MAEIVTGALVSVILERTIDTLTSRFFHTFGARNDIKKELIHLKISLLAIHVLLFVAEQQQFTDPLVRDWLLRVKDVVFEAEELLDEMDYVLSKRQVEAKSQSATKKVWNSLKSYFVTFFENENESSMEQVIDYLEDFSKLIYTYLPNDCHHGLEDLAADSEKTAIMPFKRKRPEEHSSNHQDNALVLQSQKSSWPEILSTFDRMVQNQLKQEVEEIQKSKKELEDANLKVAELEAKLSEMAQDRDDALAKLQRTIEDYARHRDEREAAKVSSNC